MYFSQQQNKGFTLIELLLYLSLATIMLAVLCGIGVNVLQSRAKAKAQEEVRSTAQFVLEQIAFAVEGAEAITQPTQAGSSTTLILEMVDASLDPTIVTFENESIHMQKGAGPQESLVGNGASISSLVFHNSTQGEGGGALRVELHVEAFHEGSSSAFQASSTYYASMSIRP